MLAGIKQQARSRVSNSLSQWQVWGMRCDTSPAHSPTALSIRLAALGHVTSTLIHQTDPQQCEKKVQICQSSVPFFFPQSSNRHHLPPSFRYWISSMATMVRTSGWNTAKGYGRRKDGNEAGGKKSKKIKPTTSRRRRRRKKERKKKTSAKTEAATKRLLVSSGAGAFVWNENSECLRDYSGLAGLQLSVGP